MCSTSGFARVRSAGTAKTATSGQIAAVTLAELESRCPQGPAWLVGFAQRSLLRGLMLLVGLWPCGSDGVAWAQASPTAGVAVGNAVVQEGDSGTVTATFTVKLTAPLISPDRMTNWMPGIVEDLQLHLPLGPDKLPVRTQVCATPAPGANLNTAITNCPEGQVVQLQAGTYTVSSTIVLRKGVVVRGMGSQGAATGGTTIVRTGGGSVMSIGTSQDGACYAWGSYSEPAYALVADTVKDTSVVRLGGNASKFKAGDFALIDQIDDASMTARNDCPYFKREGSPARSISQRVEVASVDAANGTVTLRTPLHWSFKTASPYSAQMVRVTAAVTKWAGIEKVRLQGGTNPGYNGQMAGGIDISNAAYCWVKDVQTDGTIGGMHISLKGAYRCVVRDSYVHHSADYGFGRDCYGIVVGCGSADSLVENNIARYMNKPIQLSVSGGGNVIGYNYADNAWSDQDGSFQEVPFDSHCSYPHMELVEGNFAPHMATPDTHGATGYLTFFRNYASSQFAYPPVFGHTTQQSGDVQAVSFCPACNYMNVVGNVLGPAAGSDPRSAVDLQSYICIDEYDPCVLNFGPNGATASPSYQTVQLHGNYDTVNQAVMWDSANVRRDLPASLYLTTKPAWWPASSPWPWVGPDLVPMVGTLPAKARSDAMAP